MYKDATSQEINGLMEDAWQAFHEYRVLSLKQRATFMRCIATEMDAASDQLIQTAMTETHLPDPRLRGEKNRTIFQLNNYADACEKGEWLGVSIDTAIPDKTPPKPDIRKMLIPIGPVLVFGASNFPFAYSTAGGDTACALAAGCSVIVKAHPAHPQTSELVAQCIVKAIEKCGMPKGVFQHVHGTSFEIGKHLITHSLVKAVGFTGSYSGGKALFDLANQRKEPIPVFAEMSSINPVFLLSGKLKSDPAGVAKMYAASITLSVGQFCTNPGLIIGTEGQALNDFMSLLGDEIRKTNPGEMLHPGIAKSFVEKRAAALVQEEVSVVAIADCPPKENEGTPTIASVSAESFLNNPVLHQEVFGPYSLVVRCRDMQEMNMLAAKLEGQLTCTLMATDTDIRENQELVEKVKNLCGRLILNGVPTGVEVCLSMQHGGPFPATTDSRFTSVGADGIKRFARPMSFQNWSDELLPNELKNANPLGLWRTINSELSKGSV